MLRALFPLLLVVSSAAHGLSDYDANLCAEAQRLIVNAGTDEFPVTVLRGTSNGFHTIQMDADGDSGTVTVATTYGTVEVDGAELVTHVACKMVNRDRVNDVLGRKLGGPERSCAAVNIRTYEAALDSLSEAERVNYATNGLALRFGPDYIAASGAEWLPSEIADFIHYRPAAGDDAAYLEIVAPSVRVPWNTEQREFYQGTHHCKLISLAAMQRWMRTVSFSDAQELFPRGADECTAPTSMGSAVGSCLFWFAPANGMYCQDYSGRG